MLVVPSCDSNILFVSLRAKGGVCVSAFSRHIFFAFCRRDSSYKREMATKPLLSFCQTRSARLRFVKRYKSVTEDRGWDDYLAVFG